LLPTSDRHSLPASRRAALKRPIFPQCSQPQEMACARRLGQCS
jgi:hypothetical protein